MNTSVGGAIGQQGSVAKTLYGTLVQLLQVWAVMLVAKIEMQLVGRQFGSGSTTTLKKLLTLLPQVMFAGLEVTWSVPVAPELVTMTVKVCWQVPEGGKYCRTGGLVQHVSMAVAEKFTGRQLLHVKNEMFVHWIERHGLPGRGP